RPGWQAPGPNPVKLASSHRASNGPMPRQPFVATSQQGRLAKDDCFRSVPARGQSTSGAVVVDCALLSGIAAHAAGNAEHEPTTTRPNAIQKERHHDDEGIDSITRGRCDACRRTTHERVRI